MRPSPPGARAPKRPRRCSRRHHERTALRSGTLQLRVGSPLRFQRVVLAAREREERHIHERNHGDPRHPQVRRHQGICHGVAGHPDEPRVTPVLKKVGAVVAKRGLDRLDAEMLRVERLLERVKRREEEDRIANEVGRGDLLEDIAHAHPGPNKLKATVDEKILKAALVPTPKDAKHTRAHPVDAVGSLNSCLYQQVCRCSLSTTHRKADCQRIASSKCIRTTQSCNRGSHGVAKYMRPVYLNRATFSLSQVYKHGNTGVRFRR
mmetsp:Transcript_39471/g.82812  ORF Transcript_39471/g.82812 Transcript_39471/m.82812 type:complete len:264 (+) Transcript_39471:1326-2117(+)